MSTTYYLACKAHKVCAWVGQSSVGRFHFYGSEKIDGFVSQHLECGAISLLSEHSIEDYEEVQIDATKDQLEKDAMRYRWLRVYPNHYFPEEQRLSGVDLDEAVDLMLQNGVTSIR